MGSKKPIIIYLKIFFNDYPKIKIYVGLRIDQ